MASMDDTLQTVPAHRRIVVGTDGSPTATAALRRASAVARSEAAHLHVVTAYEPRLPTHAELSSLEEPMQWKASPGETAEVISHEGAELARRIGVEVTAHSEPGDPARVLLDVAEKVGADLIVVGNKGMTGRIALLAPSVPNRISHQARCDVLVVATASAA
jgi:nucleotide-binding universal stress UspA family protein